MDSLEDASSKWQEYIGRNNLGVSGCRQRRPSTVVESRLRACRITADCGICRAKKLLRRAPQSVSGLHVRNPATGEETLVQSIEDAARKAKALTQRSGASLESGMDVYDSKTGRPVANIKADGTAKPVETGRPSARARSEAAVAKLNAEQPQTIQQAQPNQA